MRPVGRRPVNRVRKIMEDLPEGRGTLYTHVDCDCGYCMHVESDAEGDVIKCEDCGTKMRVRRT